MEQDLNTKEYKQPLLDPQKGEKESSQSDEEIAIKKDNSFGMKLYLLFEDPESSKAAKVISYIVIFLILLSISILILESDRDIKTSVSEEVWHSLEIIITFAFTIEFVTRFAVCYKGGKTPPQFLCNFINICDLISIMPLYVEWVLHDHTADTRFFRILRMVRIIRLFKLGKYSKSMQLFALVMYKARESLSVFFSLFAIALIFFASLIFMFESGYYDEISGKYLYDDKTETLFTSIPSSLWWAAVTMSTVGYGDMFPKTPIGRVFGTLTILTGIFVIVLPVGIVCNEFNKSYEKKTYGQKDKMNQDQHETLPQGETNLSQINQLLPLDQLQNLKNLDQAGIESLEKVQNNLEQAAKELKDLIARLKK